MEAGRKLLTLGCMRNAKVVAMAVAIALGTPLAASGQNLYKFILRATAYQTNSSGNIVATPITDQTLLKDAANRGGITNLSTVEMVYHLNGDPKGDTVEIYSTNRTELALEFGFWFGADATLGRYAMTNGTKTEQRRIDYLYTLNTTTYTHASSDSVGAAFVSRRFLTDTSGNTNAIIEGPMSWMVAPQGTNGTIICIGNFTLGPPAF